MLQNVTHDMTAADIIRPAARADAPAVAALVTLAYRVEDFFVAGDRTNPDDILARLDRGTFLMLVEASGALAGCV